MRIAYLYHRSDTMGGAPIHLRDLSRRLIDSGHEARIVLAGDGLFLGNLEAHDVPFETLKYLQRDPNPLKDFPAIWEVTRRLRDFQPDLISAHCPKAGFIGRIAGRLLKTPTVYTPHCWPFVDGSPHAKIYLALEKLVIPFTRHIFLVSEDERDEALSHRLCPTELMTTIHNGMTDPDSVVPSNPGSSPPRMIMVARFEPQKDHDTLFHALDGIRHLDWRLDLVGSGKSEASFQERAEQMGLQDRIVFHGHSTRVSELLAEAQVFLLITNWEGFPRSTLEAMRGGLPSIVTDVGGNREAFVEGDEGLLVEKNSIEGVTKALSTLLADPERRVEMGHSARRTFERHFTFDRMYERYVAAYRGLLEDDEVPAFEVPSPGRES